MELSERIELIIKENGLKQKEFAAQMGVTESYISALLSKRNTKLSQPLAKLIEEKYGYNALWILTGKGPKLKQVSKNPELSAIHKKAIMRVEEMSDEKIKAVLAFIRYLEEVDQDLSISNRDKEHQE